MIGCQMTIIEYLNQYFKEVFPWLFVSRIAPKKTFKTEYVVYPSGTVTFDYTPSGDVRKWNGLGESWKWNESLGKWDQQTGRGWVGSE